MVRPSPKIEIPYYPIKSISEQLDEGKTHREIGDSFGVSRQYISKRVKFEKEQSK